jgi:Methylase involved in ubiquinone/menaquinone biosynthesis
LRSITELFDDWAGTYDEEIDDIGGPLTGYRHSIKKAYKNYPEAAENVLDIGIGTGNFIAEYIKDAKNVYGVDISPKMLEETKKKFPSIKVETGDFNNIPLKVIILI